MALRFKIDPRLSKGKSGWKEILLFCSEVCFQFSDGCYVTARSLYDDDDMLGNVWLLIAMETDPECAGFDHVFFYDFHWIMTIS